jgi:hypothetical protein
MADFVKFRHFVLELGKGTHQLHAAGHTLKVYLTNAAPSVEDDSVKADLAEITPENGYPAGGTDVQNDYTEATGTGSLTGTDVTFTADGGAFGPFQYAVLYNDTPAVSPIDPLIGYWDYGASVTCLDGETFKVDFGAEILTIA